MVLTRSRHALENRPTTVNVMRMKGTLNSYLRKVSEQADEMTFHLSEYPHASFIFDAFSGIDSVKRR